MTDTIHNAPDKSELRRALRQQRRQLTFAEQHRAARRLKRRMLARREFRNARRIAFYFANDGELSTDLLLEHAQRMGKQCFVPVLRGKRMLFQRYQPGQTLQHNRYGIPEPVATRPQYSHPRQLDLLLMPLVGFDRRGCRLGMGGGFYDRSLAFLQKSPAASHSLRLIGVAHQNQEVERLPRDDWDIPLNAIVTDREYIDCQAAAPGS